MDDSSQTKKGCAIGSTLIEANDQFLGNRQFAMGPIGLVKILIERDQIRIEANWRGPSTGVAGRLEIAAVNSRAASSSRFWIRAISPRIACKR